MKIGDDSEPLVLSGAIEVAEQAASGLAPRGYQFGDGVGT
jgi:hypothetical protein